MTSKVNPLTLTKAFKKACDVIQISYVDGNPKTACRNGGWHINQVERRSYGGFSVTPLDFVSEDQGERAANAKLLERRISYAKKYAPQLG